MKSSFRLENGAVVNFERIPLMEPFGTPAGHLGVSFPVGNGSSLIRTSGVDETEALLEAFKSYLESRDVYARLTSERLLDIDVSLNNIGNGITNLRG